MKIIQSIISISEKNPTTCSICVSVITTIEETITDPENEALVTNALLEACKLLFPDEQQQADCINQVNIYFPDIIDTIVNDYANPQQVCELIAACP